MEIIGRGGFGTIYAMDDPKFAKKIHKSVANCKSLSYEFVMQQIAYEVTNGNPFYGVPKPQQWRLNHNKDGCSYVMDRIYPPDKGKYTWHLYLDHHDQYYDYIIDNSDGAIRGRYLGPSALLSLLPFININDMSYHAGMLLSSVQYGSLQTARDTELIIGYSHESEDLKIFLIDYDRSDPWSLNNPPYEELAGTLEDEPYWPYPGSPLYSDFKKGYIDAAEKYGLEDIAMNVLKERQT